MTKSVPIFLCGDQGLGLFLSLVSLIIKVIESSGRQGVYSRPSLVAQPQLCLMRLGAAPALGQAAIFMVTLRSGHDAAILEPFL